MSESGKLKVGITGGIGSGKSELTKYLEKEGYPVLRSDSIAREIMLTDLKVKKKIISAFGADSYDTSGLNTRFLSEKLFSSEENVSLINSIVHPPTTKKINELTEQFFEKSNLVFVESALIYEANIEDQFDYVILVYCDENTRIQRVVERDNKSSESVISRMKHQIKDEDKKELADFVIENDSSIEDLKRRTNFVLSLIKSIHS